jgi:hypothetical protein
LSIIERESLLEWADEVLLKGLEEKEEVIKAEDGFIDFLVKKSGSSKEDYEANLISGKAGDTLNP